jgi:hypothetical protein
MTNLLRTTAGLLPLLLSLGMCAQTTPPPTPAFPPSSPTHVSAPAPVPALTETERLTMLNDWRKIIIKRAELNGLEGAYNQSMARIREAHQLPSNAQFQMDLDRDVVMVVIPPSAPAPATPVPAGKGHSATVPVVPVTK